MRRSCIVTAAMLPGLVCAASDANVAPLPLPLIAPAYNGTGIYLDVNRDSIFRLILARPAAVRHRGNDRPQRAAASAIPAIVSSFMAPLALPSAISKLA